MFDPNALPMHGNTSTVGFGSAKKPPAPKSSPTPASYKVPGKGFVAKKEHRLAALGDSDRKHNTSTMSMGSLDGGPSQMSVLSASSLGGQHPHYTSTQSLPFDPRDPTGAGALPSSHVRETSMFAHDSHGTKTPPHACGRQHPLSKVIDA